MGYVYRGQLYGAVTRRGTQCRRLCRRHPDGPPRPGQWKRCFGAASRARYRCGLVFPCVHRVRLRQQRTHVVDRLCFCRTRRRALSCVHTARLFEIAERGSLAVADSMDRRAIKAPDVDFALQGLVPIHDAGRFVRGCVQC